MYPPAWPLGKQSEKSLQGKQADKLFNPFEPKGPTAGGAVRGLAPTFIMADSHYLGLQRTSPSSQIHEQLCPPARWAKQARLCKGPKSCCFLRKLTKKSQVGRICDCYFMSGPSTELREPTASVCAPSYRLTSNLTSSCSGFSTAGITGVGPIPGSCVYEVLLELRTGRVISVNRLKLAEPACIWF